MSIIIALIGYGFQAVDSLLNKYILEKTTVKPALFLFYSTIFTLPVFFLLPFGVGQLVGAIDWVSAIISGIFFAAALGAMFVAISKSELSHIGPLLGAIIPFFVLILSSFFLDETLIREQFVGVGLLILGSLIISLEKSRLHHGWHRGMLWGVIAGFLFAVSHVSAKYIYDRYGFFTGFVYTRGFIGVVGVLLLAVPSIRSSIFSRPKISGMTKNRRQGIVIFIEKSIGVIGAVLLQYAIAIGSVTTVNALNGVQFGLLILLVAFLSKFFPSIFKEDYEGVEILQEIIGAMVIAVGLIFLIRY